MRINATVIPSLAMSNSLLATLVLVVAVFAVVMGIVTYLTLLERKVAAWIQDRYGPNRCGPLGLIQPLADAVKMLFKEEFIPARADRWLYLIAPMWIIVPALVAVAVVPLAGTVEIAGQFVRLQIADINVGLLYIVGVGSLSVYAVVLGGWASNSKYSFLGGLRSTAQMISYEVPLGLTLLSLVLVSGGSLRLEEIVAHQSGYWWGWLPRWNAFTQPLALVIFFTCMLAESNRLPFDLPEAEQELVGGYHTEYSSMKFGMFMMAEYAHVLVSSMVLAVLFLGGWSFWGLRDEQTAWYFALAKLAVLLGKAGLIIFFVMQIRWTLPRFRFDQVMRLAWKGWIPAALALLAANALLLYWMAPALVYTLANVALLALFVFAGQFSRSPVTGRQLSLRAVESELQTTNP